MILNSKTYPILSIWFFSVFNVYANQTNNTFDQGANPYDEYFETSAMRVENKVYKSTIRTPLLFVNERDLSHPIIELNSDDILNLYFDDLGKDMIDYNFTIYHCDHQWNISDLMTSEYLEGFSDQLIDDYEQSFNTLVPYTNFHVSFPNEDLKPTKSGNYLLYVYEDGDVEKPVLTQKFIIYENLTNLSIDINRPADVDDMYYNQEVNFEIDHSAHYVSNPYKEIHVTMMQNFRWDNPINDLQPQFVQDNKLIYNYNERCAFEGINEFRYLDLKSFKFRGDKIESIKKDELGYHYYLLSEEQVSYKKYSSSVDINGGFTIKCDQCQSPHIDADYVQVHFALRAEDKFSDGNPFVFGKMTNWQMMPQFEMTYNDVRKAYELSTVLKQGYYNYMYGVKNPENLINLSEIEGTHQVTENDYQVLVYQTNFSEGYDRVIGFGQKKSHLR